jgi:hypothetical protein
MADAELIASTTSPIFPAELHGFAVRVGIGPNPPDSPRSHRKAMYAELLPVSARARQVTERLGRDRILAMAPLTMEAAREIASDLDGQLAEQVGTHTLRLAAQLAKQATA